MRPAQYAPIHYGSSKRASWYVGVVFRPLLPYLVTHTTCFDLVLAIKTQSRDETRYHHTLDAAITIYRSEGIRAFYRGLLPSLLGIAHVAVQFPLYEQLKIVARTQFV